MDPIETSIQLHQNTLSFLKEVTKNNQTWNGFLVKAVDHLNADASWDSEHFLTSCSVNFCALMIIFNGLERASEYMKALTLTTLFSANTSSGRNVYIYNLGSEHAVLKANKVYAINPEFKFSTEYACQTKKFNKYVVNLKSEIIAGKSEKSKVSHFDASDEVINAMLLEIENNQKFVNEIHSFVYQAMIRAPTNNFESISEAEDLIHKSLLSCYHCFIIEQFRLPSGEIRYFLHHSWVKHFSLANNLACKSYDEKGSWSKLDLLRFFDSLRVLLSQDKTLGNENLLLEAEEKCFGVKNNVASSALAVNFILPAFSGKSLRYISSKISVDRCKENFNLFTATTARVQ